MGICDTDKGVQIVLNFNCITLGNHEIITTDGTKLKDSINQLAVKLNVRPYYIGKVYYNGKVLDKNKKIRELGLPNGAIISVTFSK